METDIGNWFTSSTDYFKNSDAWKTLAQKVTGSQETKIRIKDVISQIPGKTGEYLNNLCGTTNCTKIISDNKIALLATAGVSLSVYLYTQFQGTKKEKEVLERKLREARRSTEETSDRRIKRRRTSKLRQLSDIEPSSFSQSSSDDKSSDTSSDDKSSDDKSKRKHQQSIRTRQQSNRKRRNISRHRRGIHQ
jgi:hypothetical protein